MPIIETKAAASSQGYGEFAKKPIPANYIEDVFSTWLYTGNGATQTIANGIDLAGKGGLVWIKNRGPDARAHVLSDTAQAAFNYLNTASTGATSFGSDRVGGFTSSGFSVGSAITVNTSDQGYASWTFRKQPKFFDVVTWTGDGADSRFISHNLQSSPGCIIMKCTSSSSDWFVWHIGNGSGVGSASPNVFGLNSVNAAQYINSYGTMGNSSIFYPTSPGSGFNNSGQTYVAYLFANNTISDPGNFGLTGTDNVISCGSFSTDGSGNADITLGWEPQWILFKEAGGTTGWFMYDTMRGWQNSSSPGDNRLFANTSDAENTSTQRGHPTATGFRIENYGSTTPVIYIAIRRGPMKTPTSGTSVFDLGFRLNSSASGQPIFYADFPVDLLMTYYRSGSASLNTTMLPRLTVSRGMVTALADAESNKNYAGGFDWNRGIDNDGLSYSATTDVISYMFRRAPGFFDVVCYTGTNVARTINHNLGVVPEMIITKTRSNANFWRVFNGYLTSSQNTYLTLNSTDAVATANNIWPSVSSTTFGLSSGYDNNINGTTYVAYLFASCPNVSKVGSYTGNGSSQTINCGFTAGARFVMIKNTNSSGDWYVWDTARGMVSGNDPHLSLNTTAAEVTTDDSVDTDNSGFIVNQVSATNINVSSAKYIFLAIS